MQTFGVLVPKLIALPDAPPAAESGNVAVLPCTNPIGETGANSVMVWLGLITISADTVAAGRYPPLPG